MPITDAHVGRSYPATQPYRVSREKIAEFAAALGDDNPAYAGDAPQAPPTFAAVLAAQAWGGLFADPELDLQLARTIHADQRFAWTRPLCAGDEVIATLTIDKVRARANTAFITVSVALDTTAGSPS
ncbi:FAS1-like dehydratase domain-containing protein [Propioniciclava coleopterorum]|uniref:FAS1-like dehydratase domain-containing protein n=1 Tax=Propioniciclava coleopterorum TaxID=2714937 RepID=UPI003D721F45